MTPLHCIACFYDVGFGARAVSRKTPIYFIVIENRKLCLRRNKPLVRVSDQSLEWHGHALVMFLAWDRLSLHNSFDKHLLGVKHLKFALFSGKNALISV